LNAEIIYNYFTHISNTDNLAPRQNHLDISTLNNTQNHIDISSIESRCEADFSCLSR
jgi:hypothetical protein